MSVQKVIEVAAKSFVANLDADTKEAMKRNILWSDYAPDDTLLEICNQYNINIETIDDILFDEFLRTIISEMNIAGIEYKLDKCYQYLVA